MTLNRLHNKSSDKPIGNDVWIGMDSIFLGGVSIGNGSVVATGSVVTKPVSEHVMVGGIPAKVVKSLSRVL